MEERNSKVSFGKAGNGIGSRITLPMPWLRKMGINPDAREIKLSYDEETQQIIIQKK